jgi:hypothetical protein
MREREGSAMKESVCRPIVRRGQVSNYTTGKRVRRCVIIFANVPKRMP